MKTGPKFTLEEIFNPRSVAVVGVSPEKLSFAVFALYSLQEAGFPAVYPVNPNYKEAFGLPCYPSVSAIPGPVDHVIVCIPAEKSLSILDDCANQFRFRELGNITESSGSREKKASRTARGVE